MAIPVNSLMRYRSTEECEVDHTTLIDAEVVPPMSNLVRQMVDIEVWAKNAVPLSGLGVYDISCYWLPQMEPETWRTTFTKWAELAAYVRKWIPQIKDSDPLGQTITLTDEETILGQADVAEEDFLLFSPDKYNMQTLADMTSPQKLFNRRMWFSYLGGGAERTDNALSIRYADSIKTTLNKGVKTSMDAGGYIVWLLTIPPNGMEIVATDDSAPLLLGDQVEQATFPIDGEMKRLHFLGRQPSLSEKEFDPRRYAFWQLEENQRSMAQQFDDYQRWAIRMERVGTSQIYQVPMDVRVRRQVTYMRGEIGESSV